MGIKGYKMKLSKIIFLVLQWICACGNNVDEDSNFCFYCDREKPLSN